MDHAIMSTSSVTGPLVLLQKYGNLSSDASLATLATVTTALLQLGIMQRIRLLLVCQLPIILSLAYLFDRNSYAAEVAACLVPGVQTAQDSCNSQSVPTEQTVGDVRSPSVQNLQEREGTSSPGDHEGQLCAGDYLDWAYYHALDEEIGSQAIDHIINGEEAEAIDLLKGWWCSLSPDNNEENFGPTKQNAARVPSSQPPSHVPSPIERARMEARGIRAEQDQDYAEALTEVERQRLEGENAAAIEDARRAFYETVRTELGALFTTEDPADRERILCALIDFIPTGGPDGLGIYGNLGEIIEWLNEAYHIRFEILPPYFETSQNPRTCVIAQARAAFVPEAVRAVLGGERFPEPVGCNPGAEVCVNRGNGDEDRFVQWVARYWGMGKTPADDGDEGEEFSDVAEVVAPDDEPSGLPEEQDDDPDIADAIADVEDPLEQKRQELKESLEILFDTEWDTPTNRLRAYVAIVNQLKEYHGDGMFPRVNLTDLQGILALANRLIFAVIPEFSAKKSARAGIAVANARAAYVKMAVIKYFVGEPCEGPSLECKASAPIFGERLGHDPFADFVTMVQSPVTI
jgi:hypothetical protein